MINSRKRPATKKTGGEVANDLHIAIVLDCSGSMDVARDATIAGFNEQVQTIRRDAKARDGKTTLSLVLFNDQIEFVYSLRDAGEAQEISRAEYQPDCCTAMLDAVGATMLMFGREVPEDDGSEFLVVIISDGLENASSEFDYPRIAKMIQERQDSGRWTFSYIGANQDLADVQSSLGIDREHMVSYSSDAVGTAVMFDSLSSSLSDFVSTPSGRKKGWRSGGS